ncbi:transcriptional regulator [Mucilaginibacter sp. PAMC 26640]|nr:transcriptional regulator [Mucilaginibacter sp. PAMC 26640]
MSETIKKKTNKSAGKNIRTLRHERGWSQEDVASRLGISIPAFSKIETGVTDINLSRLEQIANIFEVSVVNLLSLEYVEEPSVQDVSLTNVQKKLLDRETEITNLQRKVILLYEELLSKNQASI